MATKYKNYIIQLQMKDGTELSVNLDETSPKKALERFKNEYWFYDQILNILSISQVCDVKIEQPEFVMEGAYGIEDVDPNIGNYEGQYVIRNPKVMRYVKVPEYRTPRYQIVKATGGFGCNPESMGNAVFVKDADGEDFRCERYNILGVAKPEAVERWRKDNPDSKI